MRHLDEQCATSDSRPVMGNKSSRSGSAGQTDTAPANDPMEAEAEAAAAAAAAEDPALRAVEAAIRATSEYSAPPTGAGTPGGCELRLRVRGLEPLVRPGEVAGVVAAVGQGPAASVAPLFENGIRDASPWEKSLFAVGFVLMLCSPQQPWFWAWARSDDASGGEDGVLRQEVGSRLPAVVDRSNTKSTNNSFTSIANS